MKIVATYSGDAPTGDVRVVVGDSVDVVVPAAALAPKRRGRLVFRGDAPGVARLMLDPARGRITILLKGVDLGDLPEAAAFPLEIGIDLGDAPLPIRLRVTRKRNTLRY